MRFFIALEIPEESKKQLEIVQNRLQQLIPHIRITDNDKLHLTIAFIGEQPDELKDSFIKVLEAAVSDIRPFQVTPAYIDGFPTLHRSNTLWVGVKGDIDKLFVVRERVKDGLVNMGLNVEDRRYIPHIAIAKPQGHFNLTPEVEKEIEEMMMTNFNPIKINSLKLFESIPQNGFHKHNTLAQVFLK